MIMNCIAVRLEVMRGPWFGKMAKAPDQPLLPNDILFIPDSASSSIGTQAGGGPRMAAGVNWDR
jgi:hypothetical protein